MEFVLLPCWTCDKQFYTASERSEHHLEAHEKPLPLAKQPQSVNGQRQGEALLRAEEGA